MDENPALPAGLPAFLTPVGRLLYPVQGAASSPLLLWAVPSPPAPVCPGPARSLEAAALAQRTEPGPLTLRLSPARRARDPLSWGSQGRLGVQAVLHAPKASRGGSVWGHRQLRAGFCPLVRGARGQGQASSAKPLGIPRGLRPETILRTTNCPPKPSGGPGPAPAPLLSSWPEWVLGWSCRKDSQVGLQGPLVQHESGESCDSALRRRFTRCCQGG